MMRGTRDCPMHQTPFTLMQIVVTDTCGKLVFTRPMWLIVIGNLSPYHLGCSNRVFYHVPQVVKKQQGHPRWYGERFSLKDQTTWTIPDFVEQATATTRRGRQLTIEIKGWHNLLMRGTRDCPLNQRRRCTLSRIELREVAFPRSRQPVSQIASQPKLHMGQLSHLPPILLMADIRGLVSGG